MRTLEDLLAVDPWLKPYERVLENRFQRLAGMTDALLEGNPRLAESAITHRKFGLHKTEDGWLFREWAPNATGIYMIGPFSGWQEHSEYRLVAGEGDSVWEIRLPEKTLAHGDPYRLRVHWHGGGGDRIPSHARRVVQDPDTLIFNAQVWDPPVPYAWRHTSFRPPPEPILVYETHVGMAQSREGIGTYREFADLTIPRIAQAGYNTIQLMAIQEHPYYGSFGYQVSSFFAPSSRFGTPEDLKYLVDTAHGAGLRIVMDIIHSHAVANEVEGLSRFDGTLYQYFHDGPRGRHPAWDSRCFDYDKVPVVRFLLSNCRFWLEEYRFDGFRFDGITSMLYLDHGLGKSFTSYDDYFSGNTDEAAVIYLTLANRLVHEIKPEAVTIAEDISGLPGLALPVDRGGVGFDYRFAMGISDQWIRLTKDVKDDDWNMGAIWWELTNRRADERSISYAECHDQALVGDQTLIFRMAGTAMYDHMRIDDGDLTVDRAMALHRLIRFITLLTAGHGYLNFMGNEFGHPEWIDFPRPGNGWSYRYARRQWNLADDPNLKYSRLGAFDRAMLNLVKSYDVLAAPWPNLVYEHNDDKILAFERGGLLFVFSFHPSRSFTDYRIDFREGRYRMIFNTDEAAYGGHDRLLKDQEHFTLFEKPDGYSGRHRLSLYLPNRTALVLRIEEG
ncbi:MAG: alpha amylase C-terminal domain-containing protein [Desulfobacterales bacterium]